MPLIYQHQINQSSQLGVWHIAEDEAFFLARVPLQRSITHPHKRLQHLAGRLLLTELAPGFPHELIRIADTRKPFLENEAWHFSLSHCGDYAAAIVSRVQRVGVDVELVHEKVARVRHKFLTEGEMGLVAEAEKRLTVDSGQLTGGGGPGADGRYKAPRLPDYVIQAGSAWPNTQYPIPNTQYPIPNTLLTACWSIKEALFKWIGSGEVDFRQHLRIEELAVTGNQGLAHCRVLKGGDWALTVELLFFGGVCLSWVVG
jgi:phosphopantetheinyl transferase